MFSIKRRSVLAVALSVSLVTIAAGQKSSTSKAAPRQPATTRPVTPAPATVTITPQSQASPQFTTPHPATPVVVAAPTPVTVQPSSGVHIALHPVTAQSLTPAQATVTITAPVNVQPQLTTVPVARPTAPGRVQVTVAPRASRVHPSTPVAVSLDAPHAPSPAVSVQTTTPATAPEPGEQSPHASPQQAAAQTPAATPRSPDYVEEKGFKGRVFEVKHRDADGLASVLKPLGSGFKGATLSTNNQFRTITVRDFPENIAAIEEAIKRLDTPESPSPDIEFTVHILIASNEGSAADLPPDLAPVVKQLQSTLRYKNYALMTSAIHRGKEASIPAANSGIAESKLLGITTPQGNPIFYNYSLSRIVLDGAASSPRVQVGVFQFGMKAPVVIGGEGKIAYENIGFSTPVAVREGERVVVGTTSMGDKGLVVVLSARVLK